MSNSADQLIYKAALQLDEEQDPVAAEATLRDAIELCEVAGHPLQLIRARTFLAELLIQLQRPDEAIPQLQNVLILGAGFQDDPDLIDQEVASAKRWLDELSAPPS